MWFFGLLGLVVNVSAQESTPRLIEVVTTRELTVSETLYNKAAEEMNSGNPKACMQTLSKVPSADMHSDLFLSLGYICAIAASHLDAADILRKELGLEYLPPSSLDIHHAWMLRRQQKPQEALDILTPEGWTSEKHKTLGTTMQAVLYTDLQRWTEAWLLAGSPYVEQNAQLYIAQQLRLNGHLSKAKSLYDRVCPSVEQAQQKGCASVLNIPKQP